MVSFYEFGESETSQDVVLRSWTVTLTAEVHAETNFSVSDLLQTRDKRCSLITGTYSANDQNYRKQAHTEVKLHPPTPKSWFSYS